jgi:Rrf2 family protein
MSQVFEISTRLHCGIIFMTDLANAGEKRLSISEVSKKNVFISRGYLEQIASDLRSANLIKGMRGAGGGYKLKKRPEDIMIKEIVEAIEGDMYLVPCQKKEEISCPVENACASKQLWGKLRKQIDSFFSEITLDELM